MCVIISRMFSSPYLLYNESALFQPLNDNYFPLNWLYVFFDIDYMIHAFIREIDRMICISMGVRLFLIDTIYS